VIGGRQPAPDAFGRTVIVMLVVGGGVFRISLKIKSV